MGAKIIFARIFQAQRPRMLKIIPTCSKITLHKLIFRKVTQTMHAVFQRKNDDFCETVGNKRNVFPYLCKYIVISRARGCLREKAL